MKVVDNEIIENKNCVTKDDEKTDIWNDDLCILHSFIYLFIFQWRENLVEYKKQENCLTFRFFFIFFQTFEFTASQRHLLGVDSKLETNQSKFRSISLSLASPDQILAPDPFALDENTKRIELKGRAASAICGRRSELKGKMAAKCKRGAAEGRNHTPHR